MMVWARCDSCNNEIATSSMNSRNDEFVNTTLCPFVIARSETTKQSTNHKSHIKKQKNKRIHLSIKNTKQKIKEFYES